MKAARSLKGRALQYLAQREHSPLELQRKLMPYARAEVEAAEADALAQASGASGAAPARLDAAARVEAVIGWLVAHDYLSAERFVEARMHARSARFGNLRISQEIKQHALTMPPEAVRALKDSELARARAVRARKFAEPPSSPAEHARQARFLSGRGFSPEVIWRALRDAVSSRPDAEEPLADNL